MWNRSVGWWVLVLLVSSGAAVAHPTSTGAEVLPPKLTLKAKSDGVVRVRWTLKATAARPTSVLTVERGTAPTAFAPDLVVEGPKRRQTVQEQPGPGTHWYRARVVTDLGTSAWSTPVSVVVEGPASGGGDGGGGGGSLPAGLRECASGYADQVVTLVNAFRREQGRAALATNGPLTAAAREHSIVQAESGRMTHDGALREMLDAGYQPWVWGQNVAYGYSTPAVVLNAWLGSSVHRANILGAGFRDTGVGCVIDARGVTWWTQNFGG
jgi:uncharacterized protein YkwD